MRRFVMLFAFVLLAMPAMARAQGNPPPPPGQQPILPENEFKDSYIAPWFGKFFGDLSEVFGTDDFSPKMYGAGFGFWQRGILGAEIELGYVKDFAPPIDVAGGGTNFLTLTGSAIIGPWINLSDNQALRPYAVVGGGLARSSFEGFAEFPASSENRGVIDVGGGIHVYLVKSFGVRFDIRYLKDFGEKADGSVGLTGLQLKRWTLGAILAF